MKSGDVWKVFMVALALGAGAAHVAAGATRREALRRKLQAFAASAWDFEMRFRRAARMFFWRSPGAAHAWFARAKPAEALRIAVDTIHTRVTWTLDEKTCGTSGCWNPVDVTWRSGKGDCKAMASLLVKWLEDAGFREYRVVVGTVNGNGHAWVESSDSSVFMDPTAGSLFAGRPAGYAPAVMLGGAAPIIMAV